MSRRATSPIWLMRFYNVVVEGLLEGDEWELILYPRNATRTSCDFAAWGRWLYLRQPAGLRLVLKPPANMPKIYRTCCSLFFCSTAC